MKRIEKGLRKRERELMNPFSKTYKYVVLPLSLGIFLACIILAAVLMSIDEDKFVYAFLLLIAGGCIPLCIVCPALLPTIRRKEAKTEAAKYDFRERQDNDETEYRYEYAVTCGTYYVESPPFAELKQESATGKGAVALRQALTEILGDNTKVTPHPEESVIYPPFFLKDFSENIRFVSFEIERKPYKNGKDIVSVTERQQLTFGEKGILVSDVLFPYEEITAKIETANPLMRVRVFLTIRLNDDLYACILLDQQILHIVKKYHISIENRDVLDYILADTEDSFRQILKYGKVKRIKHINNRSVINHDSKETNYCRKLEDE